ncbi:hypothetical protein FACS1894158_06340 [Betaproteobacteria bacterium]|nr:hypothetical protein FACS1894158_06340 [Betaproteobacteria bacterium]
MQNKMQTVDDLLIKRDELTALKRDEEALQVSRRASGELFAMFHDEMQGETLMKLLNCLQGLSVEAFLTGRNNEGLTALGTALAYAGVGLKHWPSSPALLNRLNSLEELEKKIGARCTVLIREGEDGWAWPFDD